MLQPTAHAGLLMFTKNWWPLQTCSSTKQKQLTHKTVC